jgi:hypothetical protein
LGASGVGSITASDFTFKMGNNNSPAQWAVAPSPVTVLVRSGAGVSGSARVELIWPLDQLADTWLEVTVAANSRTRLVEPDVFYFGNAQGDSGLGDTVFYALVNSADEAGPRNNPQLQFNNIPITNIYDYNRDGSVNSADEAIARMNPTNPANAVKYLDIDAAPNAPQAEPLVVALAAIKEPTEVVPGNDEGSAVTTAIAWAEWKPATSPIVFTASFADRSHDVAMESAEGGVAVRGATLASAAIARTAYDKMALLSDEIDRGPLDLDDLLDALFDANGRKQ